MTRRPGASSRPRRLEVVGGDEKHDDRHGVALRRLGLSAIAALVAAAATVTANGTWPVAIALGWDAAALVYLVSVWAVVIHLDARGTEQLARTEDASRAAADAVLLGAAVASLVSVAFVLVAAAAKGGLEKGALIALAVVTVGTAWASVHTVFMLRYARLYYRDPKGGIDFHADDPPDYRDLAYVALTIGMTFQASDTDLTAKEMRRTAIRHALISYLFGAVIVAITINIVASLASTTN